MELHLASDSEKASRDRLTFPEWGTRLSLEQYLARELALRAHPWARDGMRTWFLVDGSSVLASCETFDNASRIGSARGNSWSIASVYTEEQHRGRGYATRLMDLVAARHAERADAQACVLYSDVGERIYARSGYVTQPGDDWLWEPRAGERPPGAVPVPSPAAPGDGVLQLEPSAVQLDWAHERQRLYSRFLNRTLPEVLGARAGAASASWGAYFKSNELIVLWLEPGTPDQTAQVMRVAQAEAARCGLERVRAWALPGLAPPIGARVEKRKDELPMYRSTGPDPIVTWANVQRALWV